MELRMHPIFCLPYRHRIIPHPKISKGYPALPRTTPVYGVHSTYLLHVTVLYGVLRRKPRHPAGLSEIQEGAVSVHH